ncbi:MAG: V-type ATP synthase subunit B, partial [Anaerolineae bacterium]
ELTAVDRQYLQFGNSFERTFVGQDVMEHRNIEETLDAGWRVLSALPQDELTRVSEEEIAQYYGKQKQVNK